MLMINGYKYLCDKKCIDSTNWRCAFYYRKQCRARATTMIHENQIVVKSAHTEHSEMCKKFEV